MSLLTSQILNGLKERTFAEGSHSHVTLAEFNGASIVIKTSKDPEHKDIFEDEAAIIRLLDGAGGAPKMLGYFQSPLRIVTTLAGTQTLNAYLGVSRPGAVLLHIALKTAKKLKEIHDRRIVHNDIKMDNIMVQVNKESSACPEVNIIDFGLACVTGMSLELNVGVEFYHIAPEVRRGEMSTMASDVFSLGTLFSRIAERIAEDEVRRVLSGVSRKMTRENKDDRKSLRTVLEFLRYYVLQLRNPKSQEPQEAPTKEEVNEGGGSKAQEDEGSRVRKAEECKTEESETLKLKKCKIEKVHGKKGLKVTKKQQSKPERSRIVCLNQHV